MPARDFGMKHTCYQCGAKFYDLKKPEPICPKCGANQKNNQAKPEPKRSRLSAIPKIIEPLEPIPALSDEEADDDADEVDEDAEIEEEP